MAGPLSSSLSPPAETTRSARARQTQTCWGDIVSKLGRAVGNVSTEMHYFSPFLLKIYYKKRSWGRGVCPSLC